MIDIPIVDSLNPRPSYLPLAVPADISERLARLHGAPIVWWIGQILKFLLKPQPDLAKEIQNMSHKLKFKNPIVGYVCCNVTCNCW